MREVRVHKGRFFWEWWAYKNDWPQMMGWSFTRKGAAKAGARHFRHKDAEDQKAKARRQANALYREKHAERIPYDG